MDVYPFTLKDGTLTFNANCEECRPHCASHCCKAFSINLMADEALSGQFEMTYENYPSNPSFYMFCIKKKRVPWSPYEVCVYLNEDYKCDIYDRRPVACRHFTCKNKSIYFRQFRGHTDFGVMARKTQRDGDKKSEVIEDGRPTMDSIGVIWTSTGDYRAFENKLMESLDGWDNNITISEIRDKIKYYVGEMSDTILSIENEMCRSMKESEEIKIKQMADNIDDKKETS